ncbi:uncharacterized protein LOC114520095 [Dendronephthya gigantea]|uniref:uncharacterized protein LOC114520095 n=1 Tax=Dendronephthya gigantea TaxID=151771 RepID=UPI00106D86AB|nr:uncharacterized protein LOC114520095 [Dendronephthya gigantea]
MAECLDNNPSAQEEEAIYHDDEPYVKIDPPGSHQEKPGHIETGLTRWHCTLDPLTSDQQADAGGNDAPDPANTRIGELILAGVCEPETILPPIPTKPTTANFYLWIRGKHRVEGANLHIGPEEFTLPLLPVDKSSQETNLWYISLKFGQDPIKCQLKYKYSLHIGGYDCNVPMYGKIESFSTKPHDVKEGSERQMASQVHFDVFHFPDKRRHGDNTFSKGVKFYLMWLLEFVKVSIFSDILTYLRGFSSNVFGFKILTKKHVEKLVSWIVAKSLEKPVTDLQRLYLCMVLSYLKSCGPKMFNLQPHIKNKKFFDALLKCLNNCADFNFHQDCQIMHKIAEILVENSSSPRWLTLAAHFYPYLLIGFIIHVDSKKRLKITKDCEEFKKLVAQLFSRLKVENKNDQADHLGLLERILENAPNLIAAMNLSEQFEMLELFDSEDEKVNFFANHFEKAECMTETKKGSRAKLDVFQQIPKKILNKIPKLLQSTLLDYSKSYDKLKDSERDVFNKLLLSMKDPDVKQLTQILTYLSKSLSGQDLLKEVLNKDNFKESWSKIEHEKKVNICESWIFRKCKISNASGLNLVLEVYKCINDVMQFPLNVSMQETLAPEVHKRVVESVMTKNYGISVLQAFVHIEKLIPAVQKCYISHVKETLTRDLVKKSIDFLKENVNSSSLSQQLLLCILEIIHQPMVNKNGIFSEKDFKPILDWCDVWIILFKANGVFENSKKYQNGKLLSQQLAHNILVGNISPKFTQELAEVKENVSKLCASVNTKTRESFEDRIAELKSVVKSFPPKFQCLEQAINFGKKLSHEVYPASEVVNIENIMETFNNLRTKWRERKVNELQNETFWGALLPLLEAAQTLQPLVNSMSFMAMAKICLESQKSDESTMVNDLNSLMEFLTTTAIEGFKARWIFVLNDPRSFIVGEMKSMLGTLEEGKKVDEEFKMLEEFFQEPFTSKVKVFVRNCLAYQSAYEATQHINDTLEIFQFTHLSERDKSCLPKFPTTLENVEALTLEDLDELMADFRQKIKQFSGEGLECVFKELSCSSELVSFMEEIVDDDIRFLIDAVEEHFDQSVSESSVSDLIVVHGFLAPLIKKKNNEKLDVEEFSSILKKSPVRLEDIAGKIKQCSMNVNSLRGLYTSIANRGEMTKEIISNCLSRGEYWVSQEDGKCETKMSYEPQGSSKDKKYYSLPELHDLRSRAHLIATSRKNTIKATSSGFNECSEDSLKRDKNIDFDKFINQVNLLTEISALLSILRSSGCVKYENFEVNIKAADDLKEFRDNLLDHKRKWDEALEGARKKYYFLNYYRSDQIRTIYYFLMDERNMDGSKVNCDEVLSLIHFVDPAITEQKLRKQQDQQQKPYLKDIAKPKSLPEAVGEALEKLFKQSEPVVRPISYGCQNHLHSKEAKVIPGEIFVVCLELKSPLTANVILTLYENTSNAFPEPYQIVFCSSQTTWEEIHLLLQRCFTHSKYCHGKLFCIANVELLPNEFQFRLVNALRKKQNCQRNSGAMKNYHLALICRGGDHHHIVEQFAQYTHHIASMTDLVLENRIQFGWPNVKVVTSTLPGLGKTERIKSEALSKRMNVATVSISGPIEPSKLIQRLKRLTIYEEYHCLHLDIVEVSDPLTLGIFLFQLIVTGTVSTGNQFYHLPIPHVYIEIANTFKNCLRESMVILKYFTRIHLEWQNYKNLLVSPEITSDIQVTCQYLDIYDRSCLELEEFSESKASLPTGRCQELLAKHYSSDADISFTTLHTFLGVLADQLSRLSNSTFFKPAQIKNMIGENTQGVRTNLFKALLKVSKEFASRAIAIYPLRDPKNCSQKASVKIFGESSMSTGKSAKNMVERVGGMIQWKDSNHLIVVFHGLNSQSITAMYRDSSLVPESVENLLKSQDVRGTEDLEDFNDFTQEQLQSKLESVVCTKPVVKNNLFPSYALTPDNILKMMLIILRVRANVPVIIMGETGCGKSSLVRYLANTCGVKLCEFNFHAGITEEDILTFINRQNDSNEEMWIFLDEINTCDHLGLISDIICHHSLLGCPLSENLVFLAACNPYKLRPEGDLKTAGLEGKNITDEYSELVYRVHPLPEAMIEYVWDYGSLNPEDERNYIKRMVRGLPEEYKEMLVDLLAASQNFIRNVENNYFCVSLRDVNRCIHLIKWFEDMYKKRQELKEKKVEYPSHLQQYHSITQQYKNDSTIKSIVLALAHCYLSRLPTAELRKDYRESMMDIFSQNKIQMTYDANEDTFAAIVRMEEEEYLLRMELPPGTARNAALRENVFVMLVCILNHIPIFVVGKPGCSKSLSIQLIRSNLRGRDSRDPLFRLLPQLYVVSYQGSEASTSEGIIKVFEKARKYKDYNKDGNVLPVVLLDEVGLAENSKYNPLKVLHSLLEPGKGKFPDVPVVGISNWSLDAAKMNRAIHLFRPEPSIDDLIETGKSLTLDNNCQYLGENELKCLAEAYFEYQTQQTHANFHGLRDYYSLIKNLTRDSNQAGIVNISLQRNFGGLPGEVTNIQKIFLHKLKNFMTLGDQEISPVTDLILANIKDPNARHLMLIGNGDSIIDILKQSLAQLVKETITIFGSRFEEDLSEDYNYRILSRIILCMERNCILILKDLESIYGSLYDMLNQNYTVVGKRKNCRVALGAYSNPMCQVHDEFRCIVLIDVDKVAFSDPPFLNRFEKQLLRYSDVLTEEQRSVTSKVSRWVDGMSTVKGLEAHFDETDMFIGFHKDTIPSLVLSHSHDTDSSTDILKKCKDDLMWVASPDGVLRMQKCNFSTEDPNEVQELRHEYFKKPLHHGFKAFIEHVMSNDQKSSFFAGDEIGSKTVVMTFANIHTDISQCLDNSGKCQVERLSAYRSEKQLTDKINEFWNSSEKELLVLQCKSDLDRRHLLHARFTIEESRISYKQSLYKRDNYGHKHVCIVMHVRRGVNGDDISWQFGFLCGWRQVFLDVLEAPQVPLSKNVDGSIQSFLIYSKWSSSEIAVDYLSWCLTSIKNTQNQRTLDSVLYNCKNLFNSEEVSQAIVTLILQSIDSNAHQQDQESHQKENWQVHVACDRQLLVNSSTLHCAIEQYVKRSIQNLLARIVYFLEEKNARPPHLSRDSTEILARDLTKLWCSCLVDNSIVGISDILEHGGNQTSWKLDLCLPFSQVVAGNVNSFREQFLDDYRLLMTNEENFGEDGKLKTTVQKEQLKAFAVKISNLVGCYTSDCHYLYMEDLVDVVTAEFSQVLSRSQRVSIAQIKFISEFGQNLPANDMAEFCTILHGFLWIHQEKIIDLLKMVDLCRSFIDLKILKSLTDGPYQTSKKVLFVKEERNISQEESSAQKGEKILPDGSIDVRPGTEELETDETEFNCDDELKDDEKAEESKLDDIELKLEGQPDDSEEDSERLEDILVTAYCEKMFPSVETVDNDLEKWKQGATLVLSSAVKVSQCAPEFHFLRLCVDFSRIVPNNPLLHTLSDIGKALSPKYLDHEEAFERITDEIIKPAKKEVKDDEDKYEALQKFSSLFYGRCIDTNVDTCGASPIVKHVLSLKKPELVMMMSPVILRLLMVEEMQSPGIFMRLIHQPSAMENCPCLEIIDEVLKDCFSKGSMHHDSYPAVMICDLIQTLLNFDRLKNGNKITGTFRFDEVKSPDCEVLELAKLAIRVVSQDNKGESGLKIFSAVAFLRKLFTMLAEFIARNPRAVIETKGSPHAILMTEIDSLLRNPKTPLQLFFMKQLHKHFSLFDIKKLFETDSVLPTITKLWSDEKIQNKAVFTSVVMYPEYKEAKEAYWKSLSEDDKQPMQKFLDECRTSKNRAFALFGVLINNVYLKRAVQTLEDKEEQLVKFIEETLSRCRDSLLSYELLLRVMGRRHFNCEQLQLSPESSVENVELALLILHIAWVVSSVPSRLHRVFVQKSDETSFISVDLLSAKESVRLTCPCGLRLAFGSKVSERVCPNCHNVWKNESIASENSCLNSDPRTKKASPAVHRALHLISYLCDYSRFALETATKHGLSNPIKLDLDPEIDPENHSAACFKTIRTDLSDLMKILSCKKDIAIKTMHLVIEETSDLIEKKFLRTNDFSWEHDFSKRTQKVFLKARNLSVGIKEMMKLQQTEDSQEKVTLEWRILELDEYPEQQKEQNQQLKRLFRETKQPSFEDFLSAFLHSPTEVQSKHSFLALFFAKFDQLLVIGYLHHLLKWSRLVSSALTHRISRKDAQSKSIDDFIMDYFPESERTPQKTNGLNQLFNSFKEAWNKMCPLVDQKLADKTQEKMPHIQKMDCLAYCLMESDCGIYLSTAIEILVSYQNSILDFMLSISSHRHPALHALEKRNCSGVACVTIQNVKEKEIISFQWSDDVFRFAQNNPEYGRGQEITYDFERIEIELAAKIAFGKCYLTGTLNEFIFAKELFHTCGRLLTEIRERVTQNDELPEDVCKGLDAMKEQGMKRVQDLLQQIEVVMYLLQSKLKDFEDEMTLEDLAEKCSKMLPGLFPVDLLPEPTSSIKVGHVCALYEALEDILTDGAIEGIAGIFREQFPDDMRESVDDMLSKNVDQFKPPNFLKVLRRFVFRHLSSGTERYWPKESTPLRSCLKEPSLWSPLEAPNMDEIPREITLEYTHSMLKYVEAKKEKPNEVQRSKSTSQANVRMSARTKKRHLQNFSNA